MELHGKNALVTGAAKRMGRSIALALAEKGANVVLHCHRSKNEAEKLCSDLSGLGVKSTTLQADVERPEEAKKLVKEAGRALGGLDILINNAAIFYPTPIENISGEDWNHFLGVNLKSHFFTSREFAKQKRVGRPGKIINFSDSYSASPAARFIPYGVSKAGVVALTKGLAKAYAPDILVNAVCPGLILPAEGLDLHSQGRGIEATLLKREGTVEDIVKTVLFLLENDYITGQAIFVDGGRGI